MTYRNCLLFEHIRQNLRNWLYGMLLLLCHGCADGLCKYLWVSVSFRKSSVSVVPSSFGVYKNYFISSMFTYKFNGFVKFIYIPHCVKSVRIRSFSGPYFTAFGLTLYLSIFSPNAGKYGRVKLPIWTIFTQYNIYIRFNIVSPLCLLPHGFV